MSLLEPEQLTPGIVNATNAVVARLKDFHDLLRNPPQVRFLRCYYSIFLNRYIIIIIIIDLFHLMAT